jgi:hypothetical protein
MKDVNGNRRVVVTSRPPQRAGQPRRGGIAARSTRATIGRARAQATVRVWKKRLELQAHSGLGSEAPADFRSTSPQARLEVSVSFEERRELLVLRLVLWKCCRRVIVCLAPKSSSK